MNKEETNPVKITIDDKDINHQEDNALDDKKGKSINKDEGGENDDPNPDPNKKSENSDSSPQYEEIDIDDKTYKLDDKGNVLNDDGSIFMTKEQLNSLESESEDDENSVNFIREKIGFVPIDQNGNEVVYDNTADGVAQYVQDAANYLADKKYREDFDKFVNSRSWIMEAIRYEDKHGTIEGFKPGINWSNIELTQDDEVNIKNVIMQAQVAKGDTLEDAEMYYTLLKDAGKDFEAAEKAKGFLSQKEKEEREHQEQQAKLASEKEALRTQQEMEMVSRKILIDAQLKIGDSTLTIPKVINISDNGKVISKTQKDFLDYIYKPKPYTIDGQKYTMTEYAYKNMIQNSKRTIDDDLYDAYISFTNGDNSSLISKTLKKEAFKEKKKLFTKSFTSKQKHNTDSKNNIGGIILPVK